MLQSTVPFDDTAPSELLLFEDAPEGVEGRRERPRPGLGGLDLTGGLEGREDHPVQREGDGRRDEQGGGLGGEPPGPAYPE